MEYDNKPRLFIFSGAGLSAESGIPTFRTGDDALWENHTVEDVCYLPNFMKNYELCHDFYNARRKEFSECTPNLGHEQIAKWEQEFGADRVINLTTNIDTLLEVAGCTNVHHLHGRADQLIRGWDPSSMQGSHIQSVGSDRIHYEHYFQKGELVKPNVVFFGEANLHTEQGVEPLYETYWKHLDSITPKDIVVVVGASFHVVGIHIHLLGSACTKINVNPFYDDDDSAIAMIPFFDKQLRNKAGCGLPMLDSDIRERMSRE